jgi:hypothetical protein
VNLGELALTCYAYGAMTYDDSLGQFARRVDGSTDLSKDEHRLALLHWLNQWQCRQFSLAYHDLASAGMLEWHKEFGTSLPPKDKHLWELPESTIEDYASVFDSLARKVACYRDLGRAASASAPGSPPGASGAQTTPPAAQGAAPAAQATTAGAAPVTRKSVVSFGPTAAAKILFVLRPRVFVAWDEPIRAGLHYDGTGRSYADFLLRLREELLDLQQQCRAFNFDLVDLPNAVGRPLSTPAQLLDEYYWAKVTREVVAPTRQQMITWLSWYTPPDLDATVAIEQPNRRFVAPPWPEDDRSDREGGASAPDGDASAPPASEPDGEAPTVIA